MRFMEKFQVEVVRQDDGWYATLSGLETVAGRGETMSDALRALASYLDARERGLIAAHRAAGDGKGTRQDREFFRHRLRPPKHPESR